MNVMLPISLILVPLLCVSMCLNVITEESGEEAEVYIDELNETEDCFEETGRRKSKAIKVITIGFIVAVVITLSATLDIFSVYLKGGDLTDTKTNTIIGSDGREYSLSGGLMLKEDTEISHQTLLQVVYRSATDGKRREAERVSRIGLTL